MMHREMNSPAEMVRRLLFVLCMISVVSSVIFLLVALAGQQTGKIALAFLSAGASLLFYFAGRRYFDFTRLASSFPYGEREEEIPAELRSAAEEILHEIADPATDWMTRHELRKKLAAIIQQEPRLLDLYGREIGDAHPYPFHKPLKNDR